MKTNGNQNFVFYGLGAIIVFLILILIQVILALPIDYKAFLITTTISALTTWVIAWLCELDYKIFVLFEKLENIEKNCILLVKLSERTTALEEQSSKEHIWVKEAINKLVENIRKISQKLQ